MAQEIDLNAAGIDLSPRVRASTAVVGSPAAAVETIVASLALPGDLAVVSGVLLIAHVDYTVGTNGVSGNLRIRQTDASGTVKAATGALTVAATNLVAPTVVGFDTAPAAQQVYVATLTVGSGSAPSTVSGVALIAIPV